MGKFKFSDETLEHIFSKERTREHRKKRRYCETSCLHW